MTVARSSAFLAIAATAVVVVLPIPDWSAVGSFAFTTMAFAAVLWVTEELLLPLTVLCVPILLTIFDVFPTMVAAFQGFTDPIISFPDAALTTVYAIDPIDSVNDVEAGGLPVAEDWYDTALERPILIHTTATDLVAEHDIALKNVTVMGKLARAIVEYAGSHDIDQINMGSTVGQALTGHFAEVLPKQSPAEHECR